MLNKKIIIGLIILLFLTCGVASAFDLFGDGLEPEDIYILKDLFVNQLIILPLILTDMFMMYQLTCIMFHHLLKVRKL